MDIRIKPRKLCGSVRAISSKAHAHRLLICSALAGEEICLDNIDLSDDIEASAECLSALKNGAALNCRQSGSTARFLLPVAAALGISTSFFSSGHGKLHERPFSPLTDELRTHGVDITSDKLPLSISGKLVAGTYRLPGNISSQFISGLLFALPLLEGDSRIIIEGKLESSAYVDLTIHTLESYSIIINRLKDGFSVPGAQRYEARSKAVPEGDWSNAAFFLSAGALGSGTEVRGLNPSSTQCDRDILKFLKDYGASVKMINDIALCSGGVLSGQKIDVSGCPDLFPVLAVTACGAKGDTLLYNAARLRIKECDRIKATLEMILNLGGSAEAGDDYLLIHGSGELRGGTVNGFSDHRIIMAAAVAACICSNDVIVLGAQAVAKSYPNFFEDYNSVGGEANVI